MTHSKQWKLQRMDHVLVNALEKRLQESQPYPGDTVPPNPYMRFTVWRSRTEPNNYQFIDHDRYLGGEITLDKLLNPLFEPGHFWAYELAKFLGTEEFVNMDYSRMGHPLATTICESLTCWVPFVRDASNDEDVAYIVYPGHCHEYIIEDVYREFKTSISMDLLINPNFDLPSWYQKHLEKSQDELLEKLQGPAEYEWLSRFLAGFTPSHLLTPFEQELDQLVHTQITICI
ncbi:hypothetical protein ARMGADRAFT_1071043 [Armillaria gallica]|uniref:Uncharacterized protein n=1 Tax=Armillaria gallica TaxID=47427 RepID=A0A2H3F229_ARMGA|nr:hypothetical protein ARMGADRAFT_1071043 [Armillaria gallica]